MRTSIRNIATIQTGLYAKPSGIGDVVYLQSRHFDENGLILSNLYPDLLAEDISEKHLLREGDVLFASKGTKNFAALYENNNYRAVASTSFFVLRLNDERVLPEYLTWFLNSQITQTYLKSFARGTSIPSISKQVLETLEITIPDIDIQNAILNISILRNKEKSLKQQIETLREKQIQQKIINAIK